MLDRRSIDRAREGQRHSVHVEVAIVSTPGGRRGCRCGRPRDHPSSVANSVIAAEILLNPRESFVVRKDKLTLHRSTP